MLAYGAQSRQPVRRLPGVARETAQPPVFGKENGLGATPGAGVLWHASVFLS